MGVCSPYVKMTFKFILFLLYALISTDYVSVRVQINVGVLLYALISTYSVLVRVQMNACVLLYAFALILF